MHCIIALFGIVQLCSRYYSQRSSIVIWLTIFLFQNL